MVLGTHHSTRKFIDINQDIDKLHDSESHNSRDVEILGLTLFLRGWLPPPNDLSPIAPKRETKWPRASK